MSRKKKQSGHLDFNPQFANILFMMLRIHSPHRLWHLCWQIYAISGLDLTVYKNPPFLTFYKCLMMWLCHILFWNLTVMFQGCIHISKCSEAIFSGISKHSYLKLIKAHNYKPYVSLYSNGLWMKSNHLWRWSIPGIPPKILHGNN